MAMERRKKHLIIMCVMAVGMFGFAFLMVPFYNVLCKTLGINGKVNLVQSKEATTADNTRTVTMEFMATNHGNLAVEFHPNQNKIEIHPGANNRVSYYIENKTGKTITVQAIPSIAPGEGARHIHKTQCFCFKIQTLKPHESRNMPIVFHFDKDLPKEVSEVTLSYTLFKAKG